MERIVEALNNKETQERWTQVIALEKYGQPAIEYLHKALDDEDKWVRYMAADSLGNLGDIRSVDPLIKRLDDPDQDVRFACAYALGNIGHISAAHALIRTCSHDNGYVRIAAEEALARLETTKEIQKVLSPVSVNMAVSQ